VAEAGLHVDRGCRPRRLLGLAPAPPLLARVAEKISDGTLLDLLQRFLDQDVLEGRQQWTPVAGVPHGSVRSPGLSTLYLHPFDRPMAQAGYTSVRSCDDFVILCRPQADAEAALALVHAWMTQHGLRLHPEKPRLVEAPTDDKGGGLSGRAICQRAAVRAPEKLTGAARADSSEDGSDPERQSQANHGRPEPDAAWLVWLFQTRAVFDMSGHRRLCTSSTSGDLAAPV